MDIYKAVENKTILMIPVYSMRSYKTGKYMLEKDGNMARVLSFLLNTNYKKAYVLIPDKIEGIGNIKEKVNEYNKDVNFIPVNAYGGNAYETRHNVYNFYKFCNNDEIDLIISEPNYLTEKLVEEKRDKTIYWCVASITDIGTPWFVKEYIETDLKIAKQIPTMCATESQVNALGENAFVGPFYEPDKFDFKIVFFPFRLSDENYKAEKFAKCVNKLWDEGYKNFKVLYTDVNDSGIFYDNGPFKKVSSDKENYIAILKGKPIIPYLENDKMLAHISEYEFKYYDCDVVKTLDEFIEKIKG